MPLDVLQPVRAELPDFLKRAIVWPRPGDGSFVSMHIWFKKDGTKGGFPGTPCYNEQEVARFLGKNAGKYDIYVCMSTQTRTKDGKPYRTDRGQQHAGLLRSVYIDIDWGKLDQPDRSYATEQEMLSEIARVLAAIGLPPPTFVINTGGGRHLHWVLTQPVQPARWQPVADSLYNAMEKHGLRFDAGVGVDCARVMRVPGTFNRKQALPRPVMMDPLSSLQEYDLVVLETILLPYHGPRLRGAPSRRIIERPASFVGAVLDPAFQASTVPPGGDDLHRPTAEDLATGCPWIADMLGAGGNGHPEPLWKEAMNVAVHCRGGEATAHRFSSGDPRYVPADTERKYWQQKGAHLGWPSCAAIARAGSVQCRACPNLQVQNASPFHFMRVPRNPGITAPPALAGSTAGLVGSVGAVAGFTVAAPSTVVGLHGLPQGYQYDPATYRVLRKVDEVLVPVMPYPIYGGRLVMRSDGLYLIFETAIGQTRCEIEVANSATSDNRVLGGQLARQHIALAFDVNTVRKFMASWIETLQRDPINTTKAPPSFGWDGDGFVFDGMRYSAAGQTPVLCEDAYTASQYNVAGDRAPWDRAVAMVLARKNPGLDCILASALAGPLVAFTAEDGLWLHAVSPPGGNKTTANRVAVAFWGTAESKFGKDDTQLSVQKKMETVRNITVFHDDLQVTPDRAAEISRFAMSITSGQGRSRLDKNAQQRPVGHWRTFYSSNGNVSVREALSQHSRLTAAGHTRVFEIEVPPLTKTGDIEVNNAVPILNAMAGSHGHGGAVYAQMLGTHREALGKMLHEAARIIERTYSCTSDERFWIYTVAVLVVAAKLAAHLKLIPFSSSGIAAMQDYLGAALLANRGATAAEHAEATTSSIAEHVNDYLQAHIVEYGVVVEGPDVKPRITGNAFPRDILIEINKDASMVWFRYGHFADWLRKHGLSRAIAGKLAGLGARDTKRALCAGTRNLHVRMPETRLVGIAIGNPNFPGLPG